LYHVGIGTNEEKIDYGLPTVPLQNICRIFIVNRSDNFSWSSYPPIKWRFISDFPGKPAKRN